LSLTVMPLPTGGSPFAVDNIYIYPEALNNWFQIIRKWLWKLCVDKVICRKYMRFRKLTLIIRAVNKFPADLCNSVDTSANYSCCEKLELQIPSP
jgi:hypothetical protein